MLTSLPLRRAAAAAILGLLTASTPAVSQCGFGDPIPLQSLASVPPASLVLGADGNLWASPGIGPLFRIKPSGEVSEFPFAGFVHPNLHVQALIPGATGELWIAAQGGLISYLVRSTLAGAITPYPVPEAMPWAFADTSGDHWRVSPDGSVWFLSLQNSPLPPRAGVVRVDTTGPITPASFTELAALPSDGAPSRGLFIDPSGNAWVAGRTPFAADEQTKQLARITPAGVSTQMTVPVAGAMSAAPTFAADGNIWMGTYPYDLTTHIYRITPAGTVTEWVTPLQIVGRLVAAADGALWARAVQTSTSGVSTFGLARITMDGVSTFVPLPTSSPDIFPGTVPLVADDQSLWFLYYDGPLSTQLFLRRLFLTLGLSPTYLSFDAAGGTLTVGVTAGCSWTAVTNDPWIHLTGGSGMSAAEP